MTQLCYIWLVSLSVYVGETPPQREQLDRKMDTCWAIVQEAHEQDIDPALAITIAFNESRLRTDVKSSKGASGPLQAIPRLWCPDKNGKWTSDGEHIEKGCDLIEAGIRALKYYTQTKPTLHEALRAYGGGKATGYANRVCKLLKGVRGAPQCNPPKKPRFIKRGPPKSLYTGEPPKTI
jgi:hypothetical protein